MTCQNTTLGDLSALQQTFNEITRGNSDSTTSEECVVTDCVNETPSHTHTPSLDSNADINSAHASFIAEQQGDLSLSNLMILANQNKGGLHFKDGLLYHRDQVLGQKVDQ